MENKSTYNKSRSPPEESSGAVLSSQAACKTGNSCWRTRKRLARQKTVAGELASGLQDRKQLFGYSQVACKRENTCWKARNRLARKKTAPGEFARGLRDRKQQSGTSQVTCKKEKFS